MASDMSEGLTRVKPTAGQNLVRRTAATVTFVAPSAVLAGAEHLVWGGNPIWTVPGQWGPPAGWSTGDVIIDTVATAGAVAVGYVAAKGVSAAIRRHQERSAGLTEH